MAQRVLPVPDVFATCPNDGKILEYYAGTFEAVYVLLHPFIKAVSIDPEEFAPATYPDRSALVKNCIPVPWAEVAMRAGLPSISAVDIGLRTRIRGLKAEFSQQEYADKIDALFVPFRILCPPERWFSCFLHDKILGAIQDLGHQWVWIGDEFGTERKLYWIEDLKLPESKATAGHCNVFTPDKSLLWTTHWDSHFSFLCSSRRSLAAIQDSCGLEGFFCTRDTEVYWSFLGEGSS